MIVSCIMWLSRKLAFYTKNLDDSEQICKFSATLCAYHLIIWKVEYQIGYRKMLLVLCSNVLVKCINEMPNGPKTDKMEIIVTFIRNF